MEKLINQTIFKCSYCSRISKSAAGIYSHELSCKKNPHNQSLCSSCKHCKREEYHSEESVRCKTCPKRHLETNYYGRIEYTEGCELFGEDMCDGKQKYIDFICDIDGAKMYSNKIKSSLLKKRSKSKIDVTDRCRTLRKDVLITNTTTKAYIKI